MLYRCLAAAALALVVSAGPVSAARADDGTGAEYDGGTIILDDGSWDGARACAVVGDEVACFPTEAEMDAWLSSRGASGSSTSSETSMASLGVTRAGLVATQAISCASTLRLYEHGGFGGRVLYFATRAQWLNLANYGFANVTSSFIVGACRVYLADYANGGGAWYPGGFAYSSAGVLAGGWNDRISSVYVV